jgi:hypothetical protein
VYERTYKIRIYDPNRIIFVKGKEVRTPTEAIVSKNDLDIIKASLVSCGCKNFTIEDRDKPSLSFFQEVYNKEVLTPLEKKVVSTYDEVKAKLSSKVTVKQKVSRTRQRGSVFPITQEKISSKVPETSFYIPLELQSNKDSILIQVPIKKEDFEIKIEDLKIESDNVLKKFLSESER